MTGPSGDGTGGTGGAAGEPLGRQLEDARAEVRLLTEQLAIAERVHQKLRGRIASLERALEEQGTPLPPQPVDDERASGRDETGMLASSRPRAQVEPGEYGFGEHEDDLLPEPDPDEHSHRWRRPH